MIKFFIDFTEYFTEERQMKYQIMLKILMLLLSKRKITAKEIAERYEISVRSVYRYVEELNVCGVPVDVARGRYGGLTIADTFRLPTGYLTREEYAAAIGAMDAMMGQVHSESLISAREKLASTQKKERADLSVTGKIIVDGGTWGDLTKFSDKMQVVEEAMNGARSLMIDYISREGEHSKRVIDPHVLIFKQNVWYVYAFCHTKQEFRTFKIGRIKKASFTGGTFEQKEILRSQIPLDFYYPAGKLIPVTLEISKADLPDVEEWLGMDIIEPRGDRFVAEATLPDDSRLVGMILSYGGAVKVLSPAALKDKVAKAAERISAQYCGD